MNAMQGKPTLSLVGHHLLHKLLTYHHHHHRHRWKINECKSLSLPLSTPIFLPILPYVYPITHTFFIFFYYLDVVTWKTFTLFVSNDKWHTSYIAQVRQLSIWKWCWEIAEISVAEWVSIKEEEKVFPPWRYE